MEVFRFLGKESTTLSFISKIPIEIQFSVLGESEITTLSYGVSQQTTITTFYLSYME